jgi:RND superfamily putative drug exporter
LRLQEVAVPSRLHAVTRRPRRALAITGLAFLALLAAAVGTLDALSLNRFEAPDSPSVAARDALADLGTGSPNVAVLVSATDGGTIDDDAVTAVAAQVTDALTATPEIRDVWSAWSPSAPDTLAARDRTSGLVLAWVPGDANHVRGTVLPAIEDDVLAPLDATSTAAGVQLALGGGDEIFRVAADQARTDFVRAELIVVPLVALLLWIVYRRLRVALATLATGVLAVVGALAALRVVAALTEVSTFAANIALVLGIGLGVDYGLLMVFRFREELRKGHDAAVAANLARRAAGRTVVFSGATVAASLAVLLVFPFPFLASFAYAGVAVVVSAVAAATLVLPALLAILGERVLPRPRPAGRPRPATARPGRSERLARLVMRRPLALGGVGLVLLLALGAPTLDVRFGAPDDRVLPADQPVRDLYDTVRSDFTTEEADAVQVVLPGAPDDVTVEAGEARAALDGYAAELSRLPGVLRVDAATGAYVAGDRTGEPGPFGPERFAGTGSGTWVSVLPTGGALADDPTEVVDAVRDTPVAGVLGQAVVGGYPAELADYRDGVVERLPLVLGLIVVVTFVVLFVMTGSLVAPLKASVLNLLSLSVMFGVLVWGFQEGNLAPLLGFTPTGTIEPSIPLLMFCVAFGLSMDYEVFLLSRIREDYLATGDPVGSIPRGIGRVGPLVTAGALVLAASFAVYATSGVTFLQQLGIGVALTILVDATIVRGLLLPASMRLAGRANWWAPGPLRRWHARFGWHEDAGGPPAAPPVPTLADAGRRVS